jgi:hypothetical protein
VRRLRRLGVLFASALALSGCTLVSTSSSPTLVGSNDVPLGLLEPTIPFTDYARVLWVTRDVYMVNRAQKVMPVKRLMTSPPTLPEVLYYFVLGPTVNEQSQGITTQVPDAHAMVVNSARIRNGVAHVDVSYDLNKIPPVGRRIAVAQFLFTAEAMGAAKGIEISINQTPFSLQLANGKSVTLITPPELAYLEQG